MSEAENIKFEFKLIKEIFQFKYCLFLKVPSKDKVILLTLLFIKLGILAYVAQNWSSKMLDSVDAKSCDSYLAKISLRQDSGGPPCSLIGDVVKTNLKGICYNDVFTDFKEKNYGTGCLKECKACVLCKDINDNAVNLYAASTISLILASTSDLLNLWFYLNIVFFKVLGALIEGIPCLMSLAVIILTSVCPFLYYQSLYDDCLSFIGCDDPVQWDGLSPLIISYIVTFIVLFTSLILHSVKSRCQRRMQDDINRKEQMANAKSDTEMILKSNSVENTKS